MHNNLKIHIDPPAPAPTVKGAPSATPLPPHPTTSASTTAPAGGAGGGGDGKLPTTGPDVTALVWLALAVAAVGAVLVAAARRRARS